MTMTIPGATQIWTTTLLVHLPQTTTAYHKVIQRAATFHKVDMHVLHEKDDFPVETISKSKRTFQFLPMLKGLLTLAPDTFKEPVTRLSGNI